MIGPEGFMAAPKATRKQSCPCPIYCRFCGAKRKRDFLGHKCPTHNCQWQLGYSTCTLHEMKKPRGDDLNKDLKNLPFAGAFKSERPSEKNDALERAIEAIRYIGVKAGVPATVYGEMCHSVREAFAASASGVRGWNEMGADILAAAVDKWIRTGLLDARSEIADCRLDYGQPFSPEEVEQHLARRRHGKNAALSSGRERKGP